MTQHALPPEVDRRVELAVIGASAGGIDALFQLLDGLRRPLRGAIVVVLHLPEDHRSRLVEVFSHRIGLPVREPHAGERVGRGTVYVAPPGYHLLVEADETFALSCDPPVLFSRPSIDVLFESCADAYGARLAGFVVTAYRDQASGIMEEIAPGKMAVTKVTLSPKIEWRGEAPDAATLAHLHHEAHEECFIANSVKTEVTVA